MSIDTNAFISIITSPQIQHILLPMKIGFISFTALFLGIIIYYLSKTDLMQEVILRDFTRFFFGQAYGMKKFARQWLKVKERVEKGTPSEWKISIMEADDMLDDLLFQMGLGGKTIDDRLKNVQIGIISNLEMVLKAHKVRNNVVHDPDYQLSREEAKTALDIYEKTFHELEAFA